MDDSFRSEVNVSLYEWFIKSLGLFDLKRIITVWPICVWHQITARAIESRQLCMSLNHSRSTLISHTDRSVLHRFKSNEPNGSPNSFKTWIKKWNAAGYCSETNSSAVFIFSLAKLSKTDSIVSKITVLNAYLLNCCIKSVSHLHSCSTRVILHLLLVWYCLTITYDVRKYETKT